MDKNEAEDLNLKTVRGIPESVLDAIRRVVPGQSSNGNLIAAFVYIFTNGDCEIPPAAMELVESYRTFNKSDEILDRIKNIERLLTEKEKRK